MGIKRLQNADTTLKPSANMLALPDRDAEAAFASDWRSGFLFLQPRTNRRATIATKKPTGSYNPDILKDALIAILDENKAEDIVAIPLAGKSALADYMIIATGRSARHVVALAEMIGKYLSDNKRKGRYEGKANGDWVLADAGDVIVHLFRPEVRSFYNLEKIWLTPEEELPAAAPKAKAPAKRARATA